MQNSLLTYTLLVSPEKKKNKKSFKNKIYLNSWLYENSEEREKIYTDKNQINFREKFKNQRPFTFPGSFKPQRKIK